MFKKIRAMFKKANKIVELEEELFEMGKRMEKLEKHHDFSKGLWCVDRDPKEMSYNWILGNVFQLRGIRE